MKAWSIIGLLFAAAILATVPVSPQVTPRGGLELTIDKAEAYTYRRARVTARRVGRRSYRYARALTGAVTTGLLPPTTVPLPITATPLTVTVTGGTEVARRHRQQEGVDA